VRHRQACLFGERDDLFDGVQPALAAEGLEKGGAAQVPRRRPVKSVPASAPRTCCAVALLCTPESDEGIVYSQRMVALLIDGLRYATGLQRSS
jgi:hypothetical protein